jgi:serine/threonine protein kinase
MPAVPLEPLRDRDPHELGGFRLLGRLGYGGMGVAYLAERQGQWAVVKVVRSDLSDSSTFRARLQRELEAMRRAEGPFTAAVLAEQLDADPLWFAMEFIPGANLTRYIADGGPISATEIAGFASGLAAALAFVHGHGIVHRDLKPSNVMMSPTGPRLIDFGIAGMEEGTHLTKTGSVVGSTGWLAPEQVTGDAVSYATDIHAWGLCVLFAATGTPPFGADTSTAAMYRVLEMTPEVPASIPQPLRDLLIGAVAKDSSFRPTLDQVTSSLATGTTGGWVPPTSVPLRPRPVTASPLPAQVSSSRKPWLMPAVVGAGVLVAGGLIAAAALGGSDGDTPTQTTAEPSASVAAPVPTPTPATPSPTPSPRYAVKVEYPKTSIPFQEASDSLAWSFDVCSPDAGLLDAKTAGAVKLYSWQQGKWKAVSAKAKATKGGRCGSKQVNLVIPYQEPVPANATTAWSKCRGYQVVIPETARYRKSTIKACVRTRLL